MSFLKSFSWKRSSNTNEKRGAPTQWWHCVLLGATIAIMSTGITFALGAANFFSGSTQDSRSIKPPPLLSDTTFFVLLSQTIPNILTSSFEVTKLVFTDKSRLKDRVVFLAALAFAVGLSLAAPVVYGTSLRSDPWVQVQTMILNVTASLATIIAGMISVFEAGHSRAAENAKSEAADTELATTRSTIDELEDKIKDLEEIIQVLQEPVEQKKRMGTRAARALEKIVAPLRG